MILFPVDFQFSASNLQDFETCPRRFRLRYLDRLRWPGSAAEPVEATEQLAQLGLDFHQLVHQHLLGLDEGLLAAGLLPGQPDLHNWWQSYRRWRPSLLAEARLYPELSLTASLGGHRLVARFDLLAVHPDGSYWIIDWKTTWRKPPRSYLAGHLQTRLYPFVLAAAGAGFNGGQPIEPGAIRLMYWYPQAPEEPEVFAYSTGHLVRDGRFLGELMDRIKTHPAGFPPAASNRPCASCVYRSYCHRDQPAGSVAELAEEPDSTQELLRLGWEKLAEGQADAD